MWKRHERPRYIDSRRWLESDEEEDASAALRIATERYLGGYGPASAEDILKWVGERRITKVRAALDALGDRVMHRTGHDGRPLVDLVEHQIPENGDFLPTFLVDGCVAGLWSVGGADGRATLELMPFSSLPKAARTSLEAKAGHWCVISSPT